MKKLMVLNSAAFVYLVFAGIIVAFTTLADISWAERTVVPALYLGFSMISAVVLFIFEGYIYPKYALEKEMVDGGEGMEKINRQIRRINFVSHWLRILLWSPFLVYYLLLPPGKKA